MKESLYNTSNGLSLKLIGPDFALINILHENLSNASNLVFGVVQSLKSQNIRGIIDIVPAHDSIGVFFNSELEIKELEKFCQIKSHNDIVNTSSSVIEIPICYDYSLGLDLVEMSKTLYISAEEIIDIHSSESYSVNFIGFLPGFAYLSGLDSRLNLPRKSSPRKRVAAGSVGIAGLQTGIYPIDSPGGWNIIGRIPLKTFDPFADPPTLLYQGKNVTFKRISLSDYKIMNQHKK